MRFPEAAHPGQDHSNCIQRHAFFIAVAQLTVKAQRLLGNLQRFFVIA